MTELQKLAYEMLQTIKREDFEYDYKHSGYKDSTIAKFMQRLNRRVE